MTELEKSHLRWGCRRGMLELDLILLPFFDQHFNNLSEDSQVLFSELLTCPYPEILSWFMGHTPPDAPYVTLIETLRTCHYSR